VAVAGVTQVFVAWVESSCSEAKTPDRDEPLAPVATGSMLRVEMRRDSGVLAVIRPAASAM